MARKPPGQTWESFVDKQIREAQARGEFDGLSGAGRPIPDLDRRAGESWWINRKLREERVTNVPPALALRRDVDRAREQIAAADSEAEVTAIVDTINTRIRTANATIVTGPPSDVWPLDLERVLARWRADRADRDR